MLYMVQVPKGVKPTQVDDFPEGSERSKPGTDPKARHCVHFRTNSTIRITEDEYNHVLKSPQHQSWGRRLLVVHKGDSKLDKARKAEAAQKAAEAKTAPKPKPEVAEKSAAKEEAKEAPKAKKKASSS